jgi:hypothetical protein
VVLYRIARSRLRPASSLGLTLAFAFGTQILSSLSRPYWSHTWSTLFAAGAVLLIVPRAREHGLGAAALGATLASLAFYCRPSTVWVALGLALGLVLTRSWRRFATLVAVGLFWALVGVGLSQAVYDAPLPAYFFEAQVASGQLASPDVNRYWYWSSTLGALVSPARGLFVYVPICLWILYQVGRDWKRLASRAWAAAALASIVGHTWLLVWSKAWQGGQSYGARQYADSLVWFFVLAVLGLEALEKRWKDLGPAARWAQASAIAILLAFSVFVNARGAYARATWTWDPSDRPPRWKIEGREPPLPSPWAWNWRYPQFMAGLLSPERHPPVPSEAKP